MKKKCQKGCLLVLVGAMLAACSPKEVIKAPEATSHKVEETWAVSPTEAPEETWTEKKEQVPSWVDVQLIPIHGVARRGEKLEGVKNIVIHYTGNPGTTAQNNRDYFASNHRNKDTISIETCHPDATGKFTEATYEAEVQLVAWLCEAYGLTEQDVIRHYDVTGKICPKYYVENEEVWEAFLEDVRRKINGR